jgi:hypothetical protein
VSDVSDKKLLINTSKRQWRSQSGFPFSTLAQVQEQLEGLLLERDRLLLLCETLITDWKASVLSSLAPIYLSRSTDKSLTILRWRLRTMGKTLSRIHLDSELLSYFHVFAHQEMVLKFDSHRLDLNYQMAMTLYEINRLTDYLEQAQLLTGFKSTSDKTNYRT